MDALELARWQFAITTVYHFLFVPITIGLSAVVAGYHTAWLRTGNTQHLRVAKFLGKLFTINFALGLVTGIVQEFQFGMAWSEYSRFVGDVFGAPLGDQAKAKLVVIAAQLRAEGIRVDLAYGGRGLKGAMKAADRSGAKFALVLGDRDIEEGTIGLKDLSSGEQVPVPIGDVVDTVGARLARQ